jgi:threonyl-tRNA synthetase
MSPGEQIELTLPDGSHRSVARGALAGEVLGQWNPKDRPQYLAAVLNGRAIDLAAPILEGGPLSPLSFADPKGREILQHSSAHLVAKGLTEAVPSALPTVGPPTDDGFYYDFDVRPLTPEDLEKAQAVIDRSIAAREPFERFEVPKPEALRLVASNRHKQSYISEVPEGEKVSFYRTGTFVDLCRGPHVPDTGWLAGLRILGFSAITAGGTPEGEPRQRVRGIGFPTRAELEAYLKLRKEAEARDHRVIGAKLELFTFVDECPGFPFWLPNGMIIVRELERFVTEHFVEDGYVEIRTPLMFAQSVFETSGHWDHYRENMFLSEVENRTFGVKPMNCPGAMLVFKSRARSYRELPLRLAEFAPLHRREPSGTLHGLTRVREFVQDDAHLFVAEEQIEPEIRKLMAWIERAFTTFHLSWEYELSTRPEAFLGEADQWSHAEAILERVLTESKVPFRRSAGEGAFYGPKIDIHVRDSLNRPWQTGTIQLDFQIPKRFGLEFQGADGRMHTPAVIHRTILGTWERFLGVLIEHCAGRLPPWLCPVQVRVLPVTDRHVEAADALVRELKGHHIRAESSGSADTLSKRVREAEIDRVPYVAVLGDNEAASGAVALRVRGQKGQKTGSRADFISEIAAKLQSRSFDP